QPDKLRLISPRIIRQTGCQHSHQHKSAENNQPAISSTSQQHIKSSHGDVDYAQASAELAKAIANLRVIELTNKAM
ncbi:hypothetical protein KU391_24350, partial [Salmonella enterica subsp. enterica serovar Mbandaka]|nr:hypothetical protein [Salmonella enterica subsp. enterica serovar Mbandaka]